MNFDRHFAQSNLSSRVEFFKHATRVELRELAALLMKFSRQPAWDNTRNPGLSLCGFTATKPHISVRRERRGSPMGANPMGSLDTLVPERIIGFKLNRRHAADVAVPLVGVVNFGVTSTGRIPIFCRLKKAKGQYHS